MKITTRVVASISYHLFFSVWEEEFANAYDYPPIPIFKKNHQHSIKHHLPPPSLPHPPPSHDDSFVGDYQYDDSFLPDYQVGSLTLFCSYFFGEKPSLSSRLYLENIALSSAISDECETHSCQSFGSAMRRG